MATVTTRISPADNSRVMMLTELLEAEEAPGPTVPSNRRVKTKESPYRSCILLRTHLGEDTMNLNDGHPRKEIGS